MSEIGTFTPDNFLHNILCNTINQWERLGECSILVRQITDECLTFIPTKSPFYVNVIE